MKEENMVRLTNSMIIWFLLKLRYENKPIRRKRGIAVFRCKGIKE
jgi:hypothetical protein